MGKITYTPQPQLVDVKLAAISPTEGMNVFEKVFYHVNDFIEGCKAFGESWGDFWESPLDNTVDFIITGIDGIATFLSNNTEIFIIVGMIGAYLLMSGREEIGKKVISGAMWFLIIAKVVAAYI